MRNASNCESCTDLSVMKNYIGEIFNQYANVPPEEIDWLVSKLKKTSVKKDDFYLQQGDSVNRCGLIRRGMFTTSIS